MAANRWQLLLGLFILVGMLLTAAFALGVYAGQNGWLVQISSGRDGIRNPAPGTGGQILPPGGQPGSGQPGMGEVIIPGLGRPDVIGRLVRADTSLLILDTREGIRQIFLSDTTTFLDKNNSEISLNDLKQGDVLGVFGSMTAGNQFQADKIAVMPAAP